MAQGTGGRKGCPTHDPILQVAAPFPVAVLMIWKIPTPSIRSVPEFPVSV
jgi:hypothetical protein